MGQLSQLLFNAAAGDESLHAEAVALPLVQPGKVDHTVLRDMDFLQMTQQDMEVILCLLTYLCCTCILMLCVLGQYLDVF